MGVTREVVQPGDGQNYPQPGDTITIHYDGYLYDESQQHNNFKGTLSVFPIYKLILIN